MGNIIFSFSSNNNLIWYLHIYLNRPKKIFTYNIIYTPELTATRSKKKCGEKEDEMKSSSNTRI